MNNKRHILTVAVSALLSIALVSVAVNARTSVGNDISIGGDLDIVGTDFQATTGSLNISKSGSLTTIKGIFNIDEAATLDSTLTVTGTTTLSKDFIVDTSVLYVDTYDNRVGIGTTTPDAALVVQGSINSTGALVLDSTLNVGATSTLATTSITQLEVAGDATITGTTTLTTTTLSGDLDLNLNELKQAVLQKLSDFPSSPTEGQMFWSTATSTPYWYDEANTRWRTQGHTATVVVAASDSKNPEKADYVCDGTADEVEIQAAIDALPSGGGKVILLEGNYTIADRIILDSNQMLAGMGYATHIHNTGTTYAAVRVIGSAEIHKEKVTISDIRITGVEGSSPGIYLYYCDYCRVIDNWIENTGDESVYFSSSTHCTAKGNKISGGWEDTDGIKIIHTDYSIIIGNNIKNMGSEGTCPCTSDGIEFENSEYNTITGNVIEGGNEYGISMESSSQYNSIVGNIVKGVISTGIQLASSIENLVSSNIIEGSGATGIVSYTGSHGTVISGNKIENSDGYGIWVTGANYTSVSGNVVRGDSDTNYGILLAGGASYGVISGNVVEGMADANASCIYLSGASSENVVMGNVSRNCTVYEFRMSDDSDNNVIIGNNFFGQASTFGTATGNVDESNLGYFPQVVIDAVGDAIEARGEVVKLNPNGDYTLTSTPTIADGVDQGDTLTIITANNEAHTATIQDQDTLADSNLQLGANTRAITGGKVLVLIWDGTDWIEVSYSNN